MVSPIVLMLAILALTLTCCIRDWLPIDVVAISTAAALMLVGLVTPEEGISGFSNPATITVMSMFILSAGIARTGAIHEVNEYLLRWGGEASDSPNLNVRCDCRSSHGFYQQHSCGGRLSADC